MLIEIIKSIVLGIVEGITEWLPISSTGHMILLNEFIANDSFTAGDLFLYVIQLGAILAVVTVFFRKLNPFALSKTREEKYETWQMWFKVIAASVPAAVVGLLFNDYMDRIENWEVVSAMLILYGIAFIIVENKRRNSVGSDTITYKTAILIGLFQVLSIVPGTSRSGATILGAMIVGCSRFAAAEFSFFLAIPIMFGVSLLKVVTYDGTFGGDEIMVLLTGMAVAYVVSLIAIRFLMNYVRKHDFKAFGIYRIVLGIAVILYFTISGMLV